MLHVVTRPLLSKFAALPLSAIAIGVLVAPIGPLHEPGFAGPGRAQGRADAAAAAPQAPDLEIVAQVGDGAFTVDVDGSTAYLGVGRRLWVVDVSDPQRPRKLGESGSLASGLLEVVGSTAYFASGRKLAVVDISDLAMSMEMGSVDLPDFAVALQVEGGLAYLATWNAGLTIVDVGDPTNPRRIGQLDTPGHAVDVHVQGDLAFVADLAGGMRVIDVSEPSSPREAGHVKSTSSPALSVQAAGRVAYMGTESAGLRVVDVSDPARPREVGELEVEGENVHVIASHAFVAAGAAGLVIVRITPRPPAARRPLYLPALAPSP